MNMHQGYRCPSLFESPKESESMGYHSRLKPSEIVSAPPPASAAMHAQESTSAFPRP